MAQLVFFPTTLCCGRDSNLLQRVAPSWGTCVMMLNRLSYWEQLISIFNLIISNNILLIGFMIAILRIKVYLQQQLLCRSKMILNRLFSAFFAYLWSLSVNRISSFLNIIIVLVPTHNFEFQMLYFLQPSRFNKEPKVSMYHFCRQDTTLLCWHSRHFWTQFHYHTHKPSHSRA